MILCQKVRDKAVQITWSWGGPGDICCGTSAGYAVVGFRGLQKAGFGVSTLVCETFQVIMACCRECHKTLLAMSLLHLCCYWKQAHLSKYAHMCWQWVAGVALQLRRHGSMVCFRLSQNTTPLKQKLASLLRPNPSNDSHWKETRKSAGIRHGVALHRSICLKYVTVPPFTASIRLEYSSVMAFCLEVVRELL